MGSRPNHVKQRAALIGDEELARLPLEIVDEAPGEDGVAVPAPLQQRVQAYQPLLEAGGLDSEISDGTQEAFLSLSSLATVLPTHERLGQYTGASDTAFGLHFE